MELTSQAGQKFKVQQSNLRAEVGFSGATVVNVVTCSGTNDLHGSLYEFLRNEKLNANNFFNNEARRQDRARALEQLRRATEGSPRFERAT